MKIILKMDTTIILPTYNEAENIKKIVLEILNLGLQIIIVDDNSPDGTGRIADELARKYNNVNVIHNKKREGLTPAIVLGFKNCKTKIIGVMDSDLSHPVSLIPKLVEKVKKDYDIAIGSRYMKKGGVEKWGLYRRLISRLGTYIAYNFTKVKDPMSGFFFMKRKVIEKIRFKSKGYKILLEILVKGDYDKFIEIPYIFRSREVGKSKLGVIEYLKFIIDVFKLVKHKR